jgi:hypothetical protein
MTDTASRVYGPAAPTNSNATLYTVPSATTAIIKHIHACNSTTADVTLSLGINGTAATGANCFLSALTIPAHGEYDSGPIFIPLIATDTITGLSGTSGANTVIISGVLIT